MHEIQQWKRQTLEQRPTEANSISVVKIDQWDEALYDRLEANLPMIPAIDRTLVTEVSSTATATASTVISYLDDVSKLGTPGAVLYVGNRINAYRDLQEAQQRPEQVRALLQDKLPTLTARFDSALDSYRRCQIGQVPETGAAIDMRTFLDGIKGELMEKARNHPGENMPDSLILEGLFPSTANRIEVQAQFDQRSDLVAALSDVGKARDVLGKHRLDVLWSRVLDHAFIVVGGMK